MGGACSTHGIDEKCIQKFSWKTGGEEHLKDLDAYG
jgi:hypothetical protein